jgi:hypothetical protein
VKNSVRFSEKFSEKFVVLVHPPQKMLHPVLHGVLQVARYWRKMGSDSIGLNLGNNLGRKKYSQTKRVRPL